MFTLLLISTFVNILLIENVRATTLASLRDAARSGAQIVDLKNAVANGDQAVATDECVNRLRVSVAQLSGADTTSAVCTIETNPQGKLFMKASITISNAGIVPWATPFERRLGNLEAIYIPTESR